MHGYTVDEMLGQSVRILAPNATWQDFPLHQLAQGSIFSRESMNMRKDGTTFQTHMISNVIMDDAEQPIALISTCEDITERKELEAVLRRQMTAIESAMDGIAVVDRCGVISYVNQAFAATFGYNLATALVGKQWDTHFIAEDQVRLLEEALPHIHRQGNWRGELVGCRANNIIFPLEVTITQVEDNGYVCILRDISERKLTEERLQFLSTHDSLTGFYNRGYVESELNRLDRSRQFPISVLIADVDYLKKVNDCHGHLIGDDLLRLAAQGIAGAFRTEDIVARFGGDEFIVLLPDTDSLAAERAISRIRENLDELNLVQREFTVSLSLGAATAITPGSINEAVRLADQRMYADKHAKRCGRSEAVSD
jgi:diguanylate cyclase (GGDEF)-like protein/PAS domain S-box-containing protein